MDFILQPVLTGATYTSLEMFTAERKDVYSCFLAEAFSF